MGGTWDLFRYPGVQSDSHMYTLGYRFRPWRDAKAIADGPAILNYVLRALHTLPSQGSKVPSRLHQNYVRDLSMLRYGQLDDGTMEFKTAAAGAEERT